MVVNWNTFFLPGVISEQGQSLLEFLLLLPMMVGLTVLLTRVNTAVQVSIVNQQYARAQTHFLTFNSPVYPSVALRVLNLDPKGYNQMVVGVSDNQAKAAYVPKATVQNVSRKKNGGGSDAPQEQPNMRTRVRVRNSVTLCTQVNVVEAAGSAKPLLTLDDTSPFRAKGPWILSDNVRFPYCRSPRK